AASLRASAASRCRKPSASANLTFQRLDPHRKFQFAVAGSLRLYRHEAERRRKPHSQDAIVAVAPTGDDHGVEVSQRGFQFGGPLLGVFEFLELVLVDDVKGF